MIKKLLPLVILSVVAALLIAGCTNTSSSSSPTPTATSPTASSGQQQSYESYFDSTFSRQAILVSPFKPTTYNGMPAYKGVVKDDPQKKLTAAWNHNITIVLPNTADNAKTLFAQEKNKAKSVGYEDAQIGETTWVGYISPTSYPKDSTNEIYLWMCDRACLAGDYAYGVSGFTVAIDYKTRA